MSILLRIIGWVCVVWVVLFFFAIIRLLKQGEIGTAIVSFFIFDLGPAAIAFYAFKHSKRFSEVGKKEDNQKSIFSILLMNVKNFLAEQNRKERERQILLEQQNEILRKQKLEEETRLANERAEMERLETEKKEKELQDFKNKYPNHWQNILDKKLALDMTLEMVTMIHGEAHNRKETVSKQETGEKYNFHPYQNLQKKTSYQLEVTFKNGLVTGWKES